MVIKRVGYRAFIATAAIGSIVISLNPSWQELVAESYQAAAERAEEARERQDRDVEKRLDELKEGPGSGALLGPIGVFGNATYTNVDRQERREPGYDSDIIGLTLGADTRLQNNVLVGAAITVTRDDTTYLNNLGDLETDGVAIALYGSFSPDDTSFVDVVAGYGWNDYESRRNVNGDVARASYDGDRYNVGVTVGKDWFSGPYTFGPRVKFTYSKANIDRARETASNRNNAVIVDSYDVESQLAEIGVRGAMVQSLNWGVLSTEASVFYQHEFDKDAQFIGSTNVGTSARSNFLTDSPDRDTFLGSVGFVVVRPQGIQIYGNVEKLFSHSYLDRWTVNGGVRVEF